MGSRRSVLAAGMMFLCVTAAVVMYDLKQNAQGEPRLTTTRRTALPLLAVPEQAPPSPPSSETPTDEGFAQFALLTEDRPSTEAVFIRTKPADRPAVLPDPSGFESTPLLTDEKRAQNLAAILDVMPDLKPEEQEFWLGETIGMAPDMIREMLALRAHVGELAPDPFEDVPQPSPTTIMPAESLLDTLLRARLITLRNLANINSIGYLRTEINFAGGSVANGESGGLQIVSTTLSTERGREIQTGRPLDFAILSDRLYLQVEVNGKPHVTRFGRLKLLTSGRLGLDVRDAEIPLFPEVKVPAGLIVNRITPEGQIECSDAAGENSHAIARLPLFVVPHPECLVPAPSGTYALTPDSGKPNDMSDQLGNERLVALEVLEGSNVNWTSEKQKLEQWDWLIEQLRRN